MKIKEKQLSIPLSIILALFFYCSSASAAFWGSDATSELVGSRTSPVGSGIYATDGWDSGGLVISWNISEDDDIWTYQYQVNVNRKDVSHFILEITEDDHRFNILEGTDAKIEGPGTWTQGGSNPFMPNDIYGIKFDFGGTSTTYTIVTDRAPVYGVFYAKDGRDGGENVVAWSNALSFSDFKTNESLITTDFIVRPDSFTPVPIPGAILLLGSGLIGLAGLRKRFK
jgi:hypothetical protein